MEKVFKRPYPRVELARVFGLVGLGIVLAAFALARWGQVGLWFYPLFWGGYVLAVDGWVYRHRGESLVIAYPGRFVFLALWSVVLWSLWEVVNWRMEFWRYAGLPASVFERWGWYLLCFAMVGPVVFETVDLLDSAFSRAISVTPLMRSGRALFVSLGGACLVLPLLWPGVFGPLLWAAPFFLLEPINERSGGQSLLSDWRSGTWRRFVLLAVAGSVCACLWAGARGAGPQWIQPVSPGSGTLFQVAWTGFLGFVPFTLSAYAATAAATWVWEKWGGLARAWVGLIAALGVLGVFSGIDRWTFFGP